MQGGVQAPAPVLCRGGCSPIFWGVSSLKNCHSFCSTDSSCLFATAMVTCIDDSSQLQLYTSIAMVHAASRNWPQYDYHRLTSGPCELQWHASPRCKQQETSTLPCISSKQFLLGFASPAWHLMRNAPTSLFYVRWMPNERLKTLKVWQHSKSTKATPSIMKSRQESKSSIYSANLRTQELQKIVHMLLSARFGAVCPSTSPMGLLGQRGRRSCRTKSGVDRDAAASFLHQNDHLPQARPS